MNNSSFLRKQIWNILFIVLSCLIFISFFSLARYALPKTDDFADMMYGYKSLEQTGNVYKTSWTVMKDIYENQQGTFFSSFSLIFLLVKTGINLTRYQHIIGALVCLFFCSYLFLLYCIAKHFHFKHVVGVFLFTTLWTAVDLVGPGEGLLYIVGACVYALPLAFGFLAIAFYLQLMESKKPIAIFLWTCLSMGAAFLGAGGVLMSSAMINIFMVWIFLYEWFVNRKFPLRGLLPFLTAFASALLNALAPGNFKRFTSGAGEAKPDYIGSVLDTFGVTNEQILHLMQQTYFLVAILLVTVFVIFTKNSYTKEHFRVHPIIIAIASYFSCYIVLFPTVLGYQLSAGEHIEQRIIFAFAWIASINLFLTWTYLLMWIKVRYVSEIAIRPIAVTITCLVLIAGIVSNVLYVPNCREENTAPTLTTIYNEYSSGSLENYYAAYHLALLGADAAPVSTAYYVFYEYPDTQLFMNSSMSSDTSWWVNVTVAAIYQLGLFAYCPEHPFSEQDALDAGYTMEQLLP